MPVVESPYWDSWPASAPGSEPEGNFVLMKIDPVASVAIFEDEETTRAAAALDRHEWVLGLVTSPTPGLPDADGKESMSLWIELIGQGPPKDKPISSLPFAPSPQLYDDRPPIELQPRLPWPDLYLHTYYTSSVLISRIHHGPGYFQVRLTEDEYMPIRRRGFQDRGNWKKLPPVTVEPEGEAIPTMDLAGSSVHSSDSSEESSSDEDDEESMYAEQRRDMGMKLLKARIYAEISLDPATCPGPLGSPADVAEPIRRIRELWTSWQDRMTTEILAKRPVTDAWIQGVEAARHESGSESELRGSATAQLDDDEVLPEDAAEERLTRDKHSSPAPPPIVTPIVPTDTATPPSIASFHDAYSTSRSGSPLPPALPVSAAADQTAQVVTPSVAPSGTVEASAVHAEPAPPGSSVASVPLRTGRVPVRARILGITDRIRPLVVRAKTTFKRFLVRKSPPSGS